MNKKNTTKSTKKCIKNNIKNCIKDLFLWQKSNLKQIFKEQVFLTE